MLAAFALALLSATALPAAPDTTWGSIRGVVTSEPTGRPVALAIVEVQSGARTLQTTSDSTGAYRLHFVEPGRHGVRVRHLEHLASDEIVVLVPARGEVVLDVALVHSPPVLDTLSVSTGEPGGPSVAAGDREETLVDIASIQDGPVDGLPQPGELDGEPGDGEALLVRGSAADLKLVLLDGAPVYAPFHMGGLIESFEPALLGGAQLYLGGAPARYDGGISYVLDLATRRGNPERHTATGALDMLSGRARAEGPLWAGASYLAAGRTVHGGSVPVLEGEPFPYDYEDALLRLDARLTDRVSLALTGFANAEGVRVDTLPWRENFARWANQAGSLRLRAPLLGADGELTAAVSGFDAWVPTSGGTRSLLLEAHTRRARVGLDLVRRAAGVRLRYGASLDRQWIRHRALERGEGRGDELMDTRSSGTGGGAYLDADWQASRRLKLRGGMRADLFRPGPLTFSPRASATWLLTERAALTLAGGRYHQYVRVVNRFPIDIGIPSIADSLRIPTLLEVASADHLSLALDQELADSLRLGLEGYYKRFQDIPDPEEVGTYNSGLDLWVRHAKGGVSGWLGYSLAWAWSARDGTGRENRFSGRQILSGGMSGALRRAKVEVRVSYGAGLPYTSLSGDRISGSAVSPGGLDSETPSTPSDGFGLEDQAPLAAIKPERFLRLDAQLSHTWTPRVASRETALTPYFRVMNALDRRDALFYRYRPSGAGEAEPVATLPVLPVFGLEWTF
ncbi:MAG TPA: TonB-dependent receptor [Longimicrobium sp.]|nr:TonB-dependent receptor [Longimicrobium sp.]